MSNVVPNASPNDLRATIQKMESEFLSALPPQIDVNKFVRTLMTTVQMNPELLEADRKSLLSSCMKAAQDGLLLDGREAALVTYNTRDRAGNFTKMAQYMPMVGGILKKVRQSGELLTLSANVAHENDEFVYELGDEERIIHRPLMRGERGLPIAAYAIAKTKDGGIYRDVMTFDEIQNTRSRSRAKDKGPWVTDWSEMAKKTVIRRLSKRLPMSTDLETTLRRDDDLMDYDTPVATQIPQAATPRTAQARVKNMLGIAAPVPAITAEPTPPEPEPITEDWNPETGEVIAAAPEAPPAPPAPPADQDADLYIALRECATMADLTRLQPDIARLTNGRRKAAIAVFEECKAKLAPPKPAK